MNKPIRLVILAAIALAAATTFAQTDAQKAFSAVKNLPGTWDGQTSEGDIVQVNFKTVSRGSAVVSEILGKEDMISLFHLDGRRLLLTHYCAIGNQPHMQASLSPDGKTITFNYVDATNLATPDAGHMQRLVLTVLDENHHTEEWTFVDHGKEHKAIFDLHRKA
ncbi:MAG: hypothetical protein WCF26_26785 [Candidatus Sulfotelmatobacter sp.]